MTAPDVGAAARRADVVIVGGGLAGLSTALAFARNGIETVVVEAGPPPRGDAFGFILWPPASRCLRWLDVLDDVVAQGAELDAVRWFVPGPKPYGIDVRTSRLHAGTFLGVLPSRLVAVLRDAAKVAGAEIVEGAKGWDLSRDGDAWTLTATTESGPLVVRAPLVVGADGSGSAMRDRLGLRSKRWQPKGQVILTAVGGDLPFRDSRQALGAGGSWGCASLGEGKSWLYAVVHESQVGEPVETLRRYPSFDPDAAPAYADVARVVQVRPWSMRVPRWATDGALVMGDAAHGMLPHFGLGGTLTLEDVPILAEVVQEALRTGDTSAARLGQFQERRAGRVAYGRRTSERWAQLLNSRVPGLRVARDLSMLRLSRNREIVERFYAELASPSVPSLPTRLKMLLP